MVACLSFQTSTQHFDQSRNFADLRWPFQDCSYKTSPSLSLHKFGFKYPYFTLFIGRGDDSKTLPAIYFETANNDAKKKETIPHLFGRRSISSGTLPLSYGNDAGSSETGDAQMPLAYAANSRKGKNFFQDELPLFKDGSIMTPVNHKPWFHSHMKPFAPAALKFKFIYLILPHDCYFSA